MNMKIVSTKDKKKMPMRGFMCQSPAATAVCICNADARSVIVPGRPASHAQYMMRRSSSADHTHTRSLLNQNSAGQYYYSRLLSSTTSTPPGQALRASRFNSIPQATTHHEKRSLSSVMRPSFIDNEVPADGLTLSHQGTMSKKKTSQLIQKPSSSQSIPSSGSNVFQVVVMRVSLHCHGCAGKVKKHLSKMEGVTSFSIDLETKMVTVRGHVSPVGVVESISKVKKAELLPS